MQYKDAEIYLTICTHRRYNYLRYIGLDTKKCPNYLGSSIVLKWWINKLGRSHFKKEILEVVSGNMDELCEVEQRYIKEYDAVRDPNYLNMNGGRKVGTGEFELGMETIVSPCSTISHDILGKIEDQVKDLVNNYTFSDSLFLNRVLCLCIYGALRYEQVTYKFDKYTTYGSCKPEGVLKVLSSLSTLGYLNANYETFSITDKLIDLLPEDLEYSHFTTKMEGL